MKKLLCVLLLIFSLALMPGCSKGTTVTLNLNGGSISGDTQFNVKIGDELNINDPVRDGYTFGGWLYIGEVVDLSSWAIDMKEVTLTAKWIASISNIYFDSDGGTEVETITQDFESRVEEPMQPKKIGHTFLGWFKEGSDTPYKFNKMEKGDVYLKAKWEITKYKIKFYTGGGSEIDEIILNYGEPVTKPQDPVKKGYNFVGWYELQGESEYVFDTIEERDIYLVARWESKTTKIKLNFVGGYAVINGNNVKEHEIIVTSGKILNLPTPKKEGFIFDGWEYNGEIIQNNAVWENDNKSVELIAKYTPNVLSYYLDSAGGTPANTNGKIGYGESTAAIKSIIPQKDGYIFDCWTYNGTAIGDIFDCLPDENATKVVLTARYIPKTYKITLEVLPNELNLDTQLEYNVAFNSKITLPIPNEKQGVSFKGWKIKDTDTIVSSIYGECVWTALDSHTLVPCYDELPFISFCHYDGSVDIVYISDEMEIPYPKQKEGHYAYWEIEEYDILNITETTSISAIVVCNSYIITYRDTWIYITSEVYTYGSYVELYNYKKPGYILKGWSLVEGDTENLLSGTILWDIPKYATLYAVFEPAPYIITYDTSNIDMDFELVDEFGNVASSTQEVFDGSNYALHEVKVKDEIISVVWQYKGADEPTTGVWNRTQNIVLTAKILINTQTKITLNIDTNSENGLTTATISLGSRLRTMVPRVVVPKSMKLVGFNYKSKFYSIDDKFTDYNYDGSNLIAVYNEVVTVYLDLNGGTGATTVKIDYNGKLSTMSRKPTAPQNKKLVGFLYHGKLYKLNDVWDVENYDGSRLTAVYEDDFDSWSPIV